MKTIVIYYSYSGNNKVLAEDLATKLSCNCVEIKESKKRGSFTFIKDLMSKKLPVLKNDLSIFNKYESAILISPVWFGKLASPMVTIIQYLQEIGVEYDLITLRGGQADDTSTIMESIKRTNHMPRDFYDYHIVDIAEERNSDVRKIKVKPEMILTVSKEIQTLYEGV